MTTIDALGLHWTTEEDIYEDSLYNLPESETFHSMLSEDLEDEEDKFHDSFEEFFPESPEERSPSPLFDVPSSPSTPPTPLECEDFFTFPSVSIATESRATITVVGCCGQLPGSETFKTLPATTPATSETQPTLKFTDFQITGTLGKGGQGTIYRALHKLSGTEVALKRIPKDDIAKLLAPREQDSLRRLVDTDGILQMYGSFHDKENFYFVTPIYGGDLLDLIGRCNHHYGSMPLELVAVYTAYLIVAIERMHARGVIHRDLKPENIFIHLRNCQPIIGDFGLGVTEDLLQHQLETYLPSDREIVGTPHYWSREVFEERLFSHKSDVFALGAIVFYMAAGKEMMDGDEMERKMMLGEADWFGGFEVWSEGVEMDEKAKEFLRQLFDDVPLGELKNSRLFEDIDWKAVGLGIFPIPDCFIPLQQAAEMTADYDNSLEGIEELAYGPGLDTLPGFTYVFEDLLASPSVFIEEGQDEGYSTDDDDADPQDLEDSPTYTCYCADDLADSVSHGLDGVPLVGSPSAATLQGLDVFTDILTLLPDDGEIATSGVAALTVLDFMPVASSSTARICELWDSDIIVPTLPGLCRLRTLPSTISRPVSSTTTTEPNEYLAPSAPILAAMKCIHSLPPPHSGLCNIVLEVSQLSEHTDEPIDLAHSGSSSTLGLGVFERIGSWARRLF